MRRFQTYCSIFANLKFFNSLIYDLETNVHIFSW
jgi:hypothetical protein